MLAKQEKRLKRKAHIRKQISGTNQRPRLSVFRSNKHIYAQLIDDVNARTLVRADDSGSKGTPISRAEEVGTILAKAALKAKISTVVFDRNGYKFHGRVKALAEKARENGLKF